MKRGNSTVNGLINASFVIVNSIAPSALFQEKLSDLLQVQGSDYLMSVAPVLAVVSLLKRSRTRSSRLIARKEDAPEMHNA